MNKKRFVFGCLLLSWQCAVAFIPPVSVILGDVFGERRGPFAIEANLKHRVTNQSNEVVEIDERVIRDSSGVYFIWRIPAYQPQPIAAVYERSEKPAYRFSKDKFIPVRSTLFWKYLVSESQDAIRDAFISERFIKREHFHQYQPDFNPTGDPSTWNLKENYVRHADIFLLPLPQGIAIAINGYLEGATSRTAFFSQNLKGMSRLEWKDGDITAAWNFEGAMGSVWEKTLVPKRSRFEINGVTLVSTDIISLRALKERSLFDAKTSWKAAAKGINLAPEAEGALKLLVSYR